nr:MAG TPA: hypothetical protein [Caudoviricetes sp.]
MPLYLTVYVCKGSIFLETNKLFSIYFATIS